MDDNKGGVCCLEVVDVSRKVAIMEAINKTDKWWVRSACALIVLCIPFLFYKLDSIGDAIAQTNTSLLVHMQTIEAHNKERIK